MHKITLKTDAEIAIMAEGGKLLAFVRDETVKKIKPGMTTLEIDQIATKLIKEVGAEPSFSKVPGYHHATCINLNDVVVHGVPNSQTIKNGDLVSLDVGLYWKKFHSDTSITVIAGKSTPFQEKFLKAGRDAVDLAIRKAKIGNKIWDLSWAMQSTVEAAGFSAVTALTGHGIGHNLHEEPAIPCFVAQKAKYTPQIVAGMVLAIEIMYVAGKSDVVYKNDDGWTIATADGKIAGLFEQTVAVTKAGPLILTTQNQ
ncbi:MAG: type I methionyl aminopeptidase [Patescibacteria group bacterium]